MAADGSGHDNTATRLAATGVAASATSRALWQLLGADLELAGAALVRAALMAAVAIGLVSVGVVLLSGLGVLALVQLGLDWSLALAIAAGVALSAAVFCLTSSGRLLRECRLRTTRRQLHLLFKEGGDAQS